MRSAPLCSRGIVTSALRVRSAVLRMTFTSAMFVLLEFDNELQRFIETRHDEFSRHAESCEITQKFLEFKLLSGADFPCRLLTVGAHRQRLVVAVGRMKEHHLGVVHAARVTAEVREH